VIDRKQFEGTNFLSVSQIDAQACSVAAVFPAALCDVFKQRPVASH